MQLTDSDSIAMQDRVCSRSHIQSSSFMPTPVVIVLWRRSPCVMKWRTWDYQPYRGKRESLECRTENHHKRQDRRCTPADQLDYHLTEQITLKRPPNGSRAVLKSQRSGLGVHSAARVSNHIIYDPRVDSDDPICSLGCVQTACPSIICKSVRSCPRPQGGAS